MLIRGHARPSAMCGAGAPLSSVHGQPVLPAGGGGNSWRFGQRLVGLRNIASSLTS